jgi:hypothetical protein
MPELSHDREIDLLWEAIRGLQTQINELIELTNQLRPQ